MNPEDLVIIDYTSMLKPSACKPTTTSLPIDSKDSGTNDPIIKLNQAW